MLGRRGEGLVRLMIAVVVVVAVVGRGVLGAHLVLCSSAAALA